MRRVDMLEFKNWLQQDSPNFIEKYGDPKEFYDEAKDEFLITEIQEAYEVFKTGEIPYTLYYLW